MHAGGLGGDGPKRSIRPSRNKIDNFGPMSDHKSCPQLFRALAQAVVSAFGVPAGDLDVEARDSGTF